MINKIIIYGAGYVGFSLAVLLAQFYEVIIIDKDEKKVKKINKRGSPILDSKIDDFLKTNDLKLAASISHNEHLSNADLIILALPTNYDEQNNNFDTSIIEEVLSLLSEADFKKDIIIKSTIPIGFTNLMRNNFNNLNLLFVPEFLREGFAIEDNLYPSRIIIGDDSKRKNIVADIFADIALNKPNIFFMSSIEAESVKLFANAYLATRISFFNELDSFCIEKSLNAKNLIDGISSDPRIGKGYNNPSFGYGGYCLPKDTKQLAAEFEDIPQSIISAIIHSNILRKEYIATMVLKRKPKIIGIYRLIMKKGSDNFRNSAIFDLIKLFKSKSIPVVIYEPLIVNQDLKLEIINDLEKFKSISDVILANRNHIELFDIKEKVITRDLYGEN